MRPDLNRAFIIFLSLLAALPIVGNLSAQGQVLPPQGNPGVLYPPTVNPIPQPTDYDQSPVQQDPAGIRIEQQVPSVQTNKDFFQVNRVFVEGNKIISDEEIQKLTAPYEGRNLSAEDLTELVTHINEAYQKKGYLTSLAFIPPQDLERGAITVKVLEGIVGDMEVSGNKYFKAKVVANRIAEKPGDPLNISKLEKELIRINGTEPYRVRASLSPGERTGETKIRLDVKEQQPFQIALTTDNAGRPGIGTYRWGAELTDRNVSGIGDRFSAKYVGASGTTIASSAYTLPLGNRGTELSGLFGFSHVNVDLGVFGVRNAPEVVGNTYNYGLLLSQPLNRDRSWVADVGLNARRASSFFDGQKTDTTDVRSIALGLNYDHYDRYGRTFARAQTTFAPEWLGANTHFFKLENNFTRITQLPKNNLLILRGYSQWSPNALPPIEQFQLGGINSVRGYTQGLLIGDRGYTVGAEWRWPIPLLGHVNPWLGNRMQGALFADYGQTWMDRSNRNFVVGVSNSRGRTSLLSAGVGIRAHLTDYMQGFADLAFGLVDRKNVEPISQPTARLHFGVRSELLSNDYKSRSDVVTPVKTNVLRPRSVGVLREADLQPEVADPSLEPIDMLKNRRIN